MIVCSTAALSREICSLQKPSATASIALGRGISAGALMGGLLKGRQRVALKFEANGPLRKMIIEADSDGALRACCANPEAEVELLNGRWNVPALLGKAGFLTVSRDSGTGSPPYQGMVQLRSSEIGDDLALYLTESEQVPSAVGVGVQLGHDGEISHCGGFLVQAIPNRAAEEEINAVLARIESLPPITELLAEKGTEGLLQALMGDLEYRQLETRDLFFRCGCSREKVEQALHSLGADGLKEIRETDGQAHVTCEFCRQQYTFNSGELERLELLAGTAVRSMQ